MDPPGPDPPNTKAEVLSKELFKSYLENDNVYFIGNANKKIKEIITHKNANFIDDVYPSARQMGILSYNKFLTLFTKKN